MALKKFFIRKAIMLHNVPFLLSFAKGHGEGSLQ